MKLAQSDDWRLMDELALRVDAGAASVRTDYLFVIVFTVVIIVTIMTLVS